MIDHCAVQRRTVSAGVTSSGTKVVTLTTDQRWTDAITTAGGVSSCDMTTARTKNRFRVNSRSSRCIHVGSQTEERLRGYNGALEEAIIFQPRFRNSSGTHTTNEVDSGAIPPHVLVHGKGRRGTLVSFDNGPTVATGGFHQAVHRGARGHRGGFHRLP